MSLNREKLWWNLPWEKLQIQYHMYLWQRTACAATIASPTALLTRTVKSSPSRQNWIGYIQGKDRSVVEWWFESRSYHIWIWSRSSFKCFKTSNVSWVENKLSEVGRNDIAHITYRHQWRLPPCLCVRVINRGNSNQIVYFIIFSVFTFDPNWLTINMTITILTRSLVSTTTRENFNNEWSASFLDLADKYVKDEI